MQTFKHLYELERSLLYHLFTKQANRLFFDAYTSIDSNHMLIGSQ